MKLTRLRQLEAEHAWAGQWRSTASVQPVHWLPLAGQIQRPQGFEIRVVGGQRCGLIQCAQVSAHRLKALAVAQGEVLLLPIDHQQTDADQHRINNTPLPGGEHINAAQREAALRQIHLTLADHSRR